MVNYQLGKIYQITVGNDMYIGSTAIPRLCTRLARHRGLSKLEKHKNVRLYQTINNLPDKWKGTKIFLLESYPCESKDELHAREGYWVRKLQPSLNQNIPGRKYHEYYENYKGAILESNRQYYHKNKAKVQEKQKEYRCNNAERLKAHKKEYYNMNASKLSIKSKVLGSCDLCQKEMRRDSIPRHMRTVHKDQASASESTDLNSSSSTLET